MARPFLRWAGGKRRILDDVLNESPDRCERWVEPFVGAGAVFLGCTAPRGVLSDVNSELIETLRAVRDYCPDVCAALEWYTFDRQTYQDVRDEDPWSLPPIERAARMIYLNRTGFNGLYRVNRRGRFNTPFGGRSTLDHAIRVMPRASERLQAATLHVRDWRAALARVEAGDFVYLDPPYHGTFTAYSGHGFGEDAQRELAGAFDGLANRGVRALLSNSDTPLIRELYAFYDVVEVRAHRSIAPTSSGRGTVGEVLVRNY